MSCFNPQFWEILVDPEILDQFSDEVLPWYEPTEARQYREKRHAERQVILTAIREIIDSSLTPIQKQCVEQYFFQQRTQEEIAQCLGISRRVVGQHLFGVRRSGKHVGGAINKIRKICCKRGIAFSSYSQLEEDKEG